MAKDHEQTAWGIDIGQAGLKAVRLQQTEAADQVIAIAYDYVPHTRFLGLPGADAKGLVRQSLDTFLARNRLDTDSVVIGYSGQNALVKFFRLPPVEKSKVGDIVKYEARQLIPVPLDELHWDYQPIGNTIEDGGFLLDAMVCWIALKRELVSELLQPFLERKIEVNSIQLGSLALQNYLTYDRLAMRNNQQSKASEDFTVGLELGCEFTTAVITNGRTCWIRHLPLGGNHFTMALVKEMKLTFERADHLKCRLKQSPDSAAVIRILRPLFEEFVSDIHRSIGLFSSVNRHAKIGQVVCTGNAAKLFGLRKYLEQHLQYETVLVDRFDAIVGDVVLHSPIFRENILSFAAAYGLALQGLKQAYIQTSLLPLEIAMARRILRKKPWQT